MWIKFSELYPSTTTLLYYKGMVVKIVEYSKEFNKLAIENGLCGYGAAYITVKKPTKNTEAILEAYEEISYYKEGFNGRGIYGWDTMEPSKASYTKEFIIERCKLMVDRLIE